MHILLITKLCIIIIIIIISISEYYYKTVGYIL